MAIRSARVFTMTNMQYNTQQCNTKNASSGSVVCRHSNGSITRTESYRDSQQIYGAYHFRTELEIRTVRAVPAPASQSRNVRPLHGCVTGAATIRYRFEQRT